MSVTKRILEPHRQRVVVQVDIVVAVERAEADGGDALGHTLARLFQVTLSAVADGAAGYLNWMERELSHEH